MIPLLGQSIHQLIAAMQSRHGFTGVIVSHDIPEVFTISHRVAMLADGVIADHGPTAEFLKSPNPAVRRFLNLEGSGHGMNHRVTEIVVGAFVVAGLLCLGYLAIRLGKLEAFGNSGYVVYADFANVAGVRLGDSVEIAGVKVGRVDLHEPRRRPRAAELAHRPGRGHSGRRHRPPPGPEGLIGDKYIAISPRGIRPARSIRRPDTRDRVAAGHHRPHRQDDRRERGGRRALAVSPGDYESFPASGAQHVRSFPPVAHCEEASAATARASNRIDSRNRRHMGKTNLIQTCRNQFSFYGWRMVLVGCLFRFLGGGFHFYGFTVFVLPLGKDLGINRAATGLVFGLARAEGALEGPLAGYLIDRFGPRPIMMIAVLLTGLGYIMLYWVESLLDPSHHLPGGGFPRLRRRLHALPRWCWPIAGSSAGAPGPWRW